MLRTSLFLAMTAATGLALAQSSSTAPSQSRPSSAPPANVAPIEAGSDQPVTVIPERPRTRITGVTSYRTRSPSRTPWSVQV